MRYKVELKYSYGWDDAGWTDEIDGKIQPTRFQNVAEAEVDLLEFLANVKVAVTAGDMQLGHDLEDYRIVKVNR